MMKYKMILLAFVLFGVCGCSLITNFPGDWLDDGGVGEKYSLGTNIDAEIPVEVLLLDNGNARIYLDLTNALPEPETSDSELLDFLGGTIKLTVENLEGGTTVDLTQGIQVTETPSAAGEYQVSLDGLRTTLTILFRNETEAGQSLHIDGSYAAHISVLENDYFVTEEFTRDVEVTN
jgi:hypothetical protein